MGAMPTPPPTQTTVKAQVHGTFAHLLEDEGDGALLAVEIGDGQGDAFPLLNHTHDDKLAGLSLAGDQRGINHHQLVHGSQFFFG